MVGSSSLCSTEQLACVVSFTKTTFVNNTKAGAIWVQGKNFHLSVHDSIFTKNKARLAGGAIDFVVLSGVDTWQLDANITASRFSGNTARIYGGAVRLTNANPSRPFALNIGSSTFAGNLVGNQGGAFSVRQSNVSITGSSFSGNAAVWNDSSAGAFYLGAVCNSPIVRDDNNYAFGQLTSNIFPCLLSIASTNFSGDNAVLAGGAVYTVIDGFVILIAQSRFDGNHLSGSVPTADADASLAARSNGGGTAFSLQPHTIGVGLSRLLIVSQTFFLNNTGAGLHVPQAALATQQLACLAIQDSLFHSNSAASASAVFSGDVEGVSDLCSGSVENLPTLSMLVLHGPPLFDPFLSKPDHRPNPKTSAPAVPPLALVVDIRETAFVNNTAFSSNAGQLF